MASRRHLLSEPLSIVHLCHAHVPDLGFSSSSDDCVLFADEETDEVIISDSSGDVSALSIAEIFNALQTANNESMRGMDRIHAVVRCLLGDVTEMPSAHKLRILLFKNIPRVRRIHVCSQDCVMFTGEYIHLKRCPKCRRLRYFQDKSGRLIPVNVFRAIPFDAQIRLLFAQQDIARVLQLLDSVCIDAENDDREICDITESIGFKEVVFDSGFMTDSRNLVLLFGTDGTNPFARTRVSTYSIWPLVFFLANLPRNQRFKFGNVIIGGLVSGHVYVDGIKKNRTVKNLGLYLHYVVKELLAFNECKLQIVDASYPAGSQRRLFSPSAMLLGTMGDYDAHGHMLCLVPAGSVCCCIKCNIKGVWYASVGTRVFAQHRRFLDSMDLRRNTTIRGFDEQRAGPRARTREQGITLGKQAETLKEALDRKEWGSKAAYDRFVSHWGVTGLCPLLQLPDYDAYDRAFLDYMHLIKNVAWCHLLKRMLGLAKTPAVPRNDMEVWDDTKRNLASVSALQARDAKFAERQDRIALLRDAREQIVAEDSLWEISIELKAAAAERMRILICPPSFYTHRKDLFEFTGSWDTIEWHHFIERCAQTLSMPNNVLFDTVGCFVFCVF
jgi:hypothetical protein